LIIKKSDYMNSFRFLEYPVYIESKNLYKAILDIINSLKNRSLSDQISRASLSIALNIAEGSAKRSRKDFARYVQISLGSLNEVVACLDILQSTGFISQFDYDLKIQSCENVAKQLGGLLKKLYSD